MFNIQITSTVVVIIRQSFINFDFETFWCYPFLSISIKELGIYKKSQRP